MEPTKLVIPVNYNVKEIIVIEREKKEHRIIEQAENLAFLIYCNSPVEYFNALRKKLNELNRS